MKEQKWKYFTEGRGDASWHPWGWDKLSEGALPGHTPLVATGVWTLLVWPCLNHRLPQVPKDWFPARCWWSSIWSIFHYFSSLRYVYRVESSEQIKTGSGLSERLCKLLLFMLSTSWHPLLSRCGLTCREALWSSVTVCAGSGWYTGAEIPGQASPRGVWNHLKCDSKSRHVCCHRNEGSRILSGGTTWTRKHFYSVSCAPSLPKGSSIKSFHNEYCSINAAAGRCMFS